MLKRFAKSLTPPVVWKMAQRLRAPRGTHFEGDYPSWQAALDAAGGYDAPAILERVRAAALKVKQGEAVFERDSVCFDHEEYRWPTLACLLRVAAENGGKLRVLDFGGSLGSFYFQHKKHFQHLKQVRWAVVEQAHYVACGREEFQDGVLRFHETVEECLTAGAIDVVFCSSVLQYLEKPYDVLADLAHLGVPYILLDRTPFIAGEKDRLTVQNIAYWNNVKIPAWFFLENNIVTLLDEAEYSLCVKFLSDDKVNIDSVFKGMLFRRNGG